MASKRRGNNEGSIYKRVDGRYAAALSLGNGQRKTLYGKTRQEVARKLAQAQRAHLDGLPLPSDRLRVSSFAQEWLASVRPAIRRKTAESYEGLLRVHVLPSLGNLALTRLKPSDLERLYAGMIAKGLSPKTVRSTHAVTHAMLEKAVRWNAVQRNVARLVDTPRLAHRELPMLSQDQVRQFLSAAEKHRLEALFVVAITTGMRSAELLGLRWQDVDFDHSAVNVRVTLELSRDGFALVEPKTKGSSRNVALSRLAVDALRRQRARQAEEALKLGPAWQDKWGLVFTTSIGTPLDRHNVLRREFRPLVKSAGLPESLTFHSLRHIAASLALSNGVSVPVVSRSLGHSDMATTMRVYAHLVPGSERQVATAFDAMLAEA